MQIPNVIVSVLGTNSAGSSNQLPEYVIPLVKALWGPRLDSEKGVSVMAIPIGAPDRYREVGSIAEEEAIWASRYPKQFQVVYPSGLRAEIEATLRKDANDRRIAKALERTPVEPHESYIAAGCSANQAASLQVAGFPTILELPDDFMRIAEVPGILPDFALELIAEKAKAQARTAESTVIAQTKAREAAAAAEAAAIATARRLAEPVGAKG